MKYKSTRILSFSPWPIILFLSCIVMGACVFVVTQSVQQYESKISNINQELLNEQQARRVLEAEWAYLTRPQRLEELLSVKIDERKFSLASEPVSEIEKAIMPKVVQKEKPVAQKIVKAVPKKSAPVVKKAKIEEIDVWPIHKKTSVSTSSHQKAYVQRVGVARPILE